MDMGVPTPRPVAFADGFTAARRTDVYTSNGREAAISRSKTLTRAHQRRALGQADAYRGHLAEGARFHRPDRCPSSARRRLSRGWPGSRATRRVNRSSPRQLDGRDLGYTYGAYALKRRTSPPAASTCASGRGDGTGSGGSLSTSCSPNNGGFAGSGSRVRESNHLTTDGIITFSKSEDQWPNVRSPPSRRIGRTSSAGNTTGRCARIS